MTTDEASSPTDMEEYYDKMFAHRYTDSDKDFQNEVSKPLASPPCVANWYVKRRNDWGRRNDSRGRGYNDRGNWGHQRDYHGNRDGGRDRYGDSRGGYYGGGRGQYGDRVGRGHYGDGGGRGYYGDRVGRGHYGDRYSGNRDQGHYHGNRYGDRSYS